MVKICRNSLEMQKTLEQKLVAVGDKKCGKSSLLIQMSKQIFLEVNNNIYTRIMAPMRVLNYLAPLRIIFNCELLSLSMHYYISDI